MTSLRDLKIRKSYTSRENNIPNEFLNPTLAISSLYYRVSAYYSLYSIQEIAEGLSAMISNNAKIKLIVSFFISEQDYNAFMQGVKNPQNYIEDNFINNKTELKKFMIKETVRAFTLLVATGRLQIKFVLSTQGIFHEKYGIIFDSNKDFIGFSGSMNETYNGMTVNFEKIKVFKSWRDEEREYLDPDLAEFEKYWEGRVKDCIIQDLPDKSKNVISDSYEEFKKEIEALERKKKEILPWAHQMEAVYSWKSNGYKGILEMATGTGKTRTAIFCIKDFRRKYDRSLIMIAAPTEVLISQWEKDIRSEEYGDSLQIIKISGDSRLSIENLYQIITTMEPTNQEFLIILGTYKMFSSSKFLNLIVPVIKSDILLVADEVHHIAAENYSKVMSAKYNFRLGLSATPERYFDEEGSHAIFTYFGGVVYKFDLREAISKDILTPYEYYIHFTSLNEREVEEYEKLTKKLFDKINYKKKDDISDNSHQIKKVEHLVEIQRARILKKASKKRETLREILVDMKRKDHLKYLLIYFEDNEQISEYKNILDDLSIFSIKIDSRTSEEERNLILDKFSKGEIDVLLSMKILDEGVDVPSVERAILVSSSGNPAQFIQRRGRLLRKFKGKTKAEIHDILISVDDPYGLNNISSIERSIVTKELRRATLFSETAMNYADCRKAISNILLKYNISVI